MGKRCADKCQSVLAQPIASNSVSELLPSKKPIFPDFNTYRFYGFTFEVPVSHQVHSVRIENRRYIVTTDQGPLELKACLKCKHLLPRTAFYEKKSPCKQCHMRIVKAWQRANPEAVKRHKAKCNKQYRYRQKLKAAGLS